jgi:long-chain-fatty-acid--[acyl-carrier-protein] ligase
MFAFLRAAFFAFVRTVLGLRYRVRLHGQEKLRSLKGPILVLPNHPAYVDPALVLSNLWPYLHPRPMVYEDNFRNPVMWPLLWLLHPVRVPDLAQVSAEARARAEQAVRVVIEGLQKGETHIMWPSGRLQRAGSERLGGARAVSDILKAVPGVTVVLVQTKGLWGSSLGYGYAGKPPSMIGGSLAGIGWVIANVFILTPRRTVDITVDVPDRATLPPPEREVLNPWLEEWYNRDNPPVPKFVPYHVFLGPRTRDFPPPPAGVDVDLSRVPADVRKAVNEMVAEKLSRTLTEEEDRPDTTLDGLGLDSLAGMELSLAVEQRFGFHGDEVPATLGQLWALAAGQVARKAPKPPPPLWFKAPSESGPPTLEGPTLAEAFVGRVRKSGRDVALADDLAGVLTYEKVFVGAELMARRFRAIAAPNVGLMMPASVAGQIAFAGLHLAGKLPVVLNWTTGPANLAHAARTMGLTHVVTSRAFLDRSGVQVAGVEFILLEELRKTIGQWERLRTFIGLRLGGPGKAPPADPDAPAVVLFTSGSEKAPKAVPLTHTNLLANIRGVFEHVSLARTDAMLAFLPAFHSFGLTITGLAPLLGGLKAVLHPDPTDAAGLVRKAAGYRPTILAGTPTFVSYLLERAEPGQLHSLRLIVVGAEKCPEAVFRRCAELAPNAKVLEGYGITECSPVVAANRPGAIREGTLGLPLPGVEVRVADLDTHEPTPTGKRGMLLVSGPTVFPGYIGHDGDPPFREVDGKRWYVTGDLAEVDADGFIHFAGRLKRFLKAGGEMISLPALEEPLARKWPPTEDGPRVAVEGVETPTGRKVVLFTSEPITLAEANGLLQAEGFRGVMRLDEVRRIDAIPVLGTGKTDYKVLRARILEGQPA